MFDTPYRLAQGGEGRLTREIQENMRRGLVEKCLRAWAASASKFVLSYFLLFAMSWVCDPHHFHSRYMFQE